MTETQTEDELPDPEPEWCVVEYAPGAEDTGIFIIRWSNSYTEAEATALADLENRGHRHRPYGPMLLTEAERDEYYR